MEEIVFKYTCEDYEVSLTTPGDAVQLEVIVQNFKAFLRSIGYTQEHVAKITYNDNK